MTKLDLISLTLIHILSEYKLCPNCLGRQFGLLTSGTTNKIRGESLLLTIAMQMHQDYLLSNIVPDNAMKLLNVDFQPIKSLLEKMKIDVVKDDDQYCEICMNLLSKESLNDIAQKIVAHSKNYEFTSFLIGTTIPTGLVEKEEILRSKYNLQFGEPLKSEFNRELGKLVGDLLPEKEVEFKNPQLLFVVDLNTNFITVKSNPLFIEGRYRKLVRGIPQSIWNCRKCNEKGCEHCNNTGRMYPDSVEEYITPYIQQMAKGRDAKIHCAGREDIDALMLGTGRPFVVEISQPKKRTLDLTALEQKINSKSNRRVEVSLSGISNRKVVRALKGESSSVAKKYKMGIKTNKRVSWDRTQIKKGIEGEIKQATPKRVLHRRADLIRLKKVYNVEISDLSPTQAEIEIYCQGGLYVKELMHGDEGRTSPSLSQILDCEIEILYLDVLEVENLSISS